MTPQLALLPMPLQTREHGAVWRGGAGAMTGGESNTIHGLSETNVRKKFRKIFGAVFWNPVSAIRLVEGRDSFNSKTNETNRMNTKQRAEYNNAH